MGNQRTNKRRKMMIVREKIDREFYEKQYESTINEILDNKKTLKKDRITA